MYLIPRRIHLSLLGINLKGQDAGEGLSYLSPQGDSQGMSSYSHRACGDANSRDSSLVDLWASQRPLHPQIRKRTHSYSTTLTQLPVPGLHISFWTIQIHIL